MTELAPTQVAAGVSVIHAFEVVGVSAHPSRRRDQEGPFVVANNTSEIIYAELRARLNESQPQPRLSATRLALHELGDPHRRVPFIHVTGTNGKTSTSRVAESILRAHGKRTGLFTSPHLVDFTERICINGLPVDEGHLATHWQKVSIVLDRTDVRLRQSGEPPLTFFEALTVLAFECFAASEVDCAVIEVGMGGAWDSTNVADGRVAVITPIALDHLAQLGGTIESIARTKSGIIKPGARVVSAKQASTATREIGRASRENGAALTVLGRDFTVQTTVQPQSQVISIIGLRADYRDMRLNLVGEHQAENAALAVAAVDAFLSPNQLDPAAVEAGVRTARSPGRLEIIHRCPDVLVDVAHNPAGATTLARALRRMSQRDELGIVLGILDDKDARGVVQALSSVATTFFVTASGSERAMSAQSVADIVRAIDSGAEIKVCDSPAEAMAVSHRWAARHRERLLVVTGSVTLVGDVLRLNDSRHSVSAHNVAEASSRVDA